MLLNREATSGNSLCGKTLLRSFPVRPGLFISGPGGKLEGIQPGPVDQSPPRKPEKSSLATAER